MPMTEKEYKEFLAKGGQVIKCRPSNKRPEERRSPFSTFNRGAKKMNLRNWGIA